MARRTSLIVDDELVHQAKTILGTRGLKDTIDAALSEVVRAERRRRLVDRFRTGKGLDLDALDEARRQWGTRR